MDDFERAVLIGFSGVADAALKERAEAFISEIKRSPDAWKLCAERFSVSQYSEVRFWCVQTLQEIIRASYGSLHGSVRDMIKATLLTWVTRDCTSIQQPLPPFIRNKVAQTLVTVLQHEYPGTWPGFFQDLLRAVLPGAQLTAAGVGGRTSGPLGEVPVGGEGMVDMFCRILVSVDEDLVSLDIPRSQDESKLSMHVKDSMREHSVADVAAAWQLLVKEYANKAPDLAAFVLTTMQRYVSWIDIGLVANDKFVSMLESLVDGPSTAAVLRGAAADCLCEIVNKRMDAVPKLNLVQSMAIVPRCVSWAASFPHPARGPRRGSGLAPAGPLGDEALLLKLAKLLAALAGEIMGALKKVENGVISLTAMGLGVSDEAAQEAGSAAQRASELLDQLFPAVLTAFRSEVDEVALPLLPFMSAYVARLKTLQKRNTGLAASAVAHVHAMMEGVAACARYPGDSAYGAYVGPMRMYNGNGVGGAGAGGRMATGKTSVNSAAKEEQAEVEEKRKDVFILFKNLAKTAYAEGLAFLGHALQAVIGQPQGGAQGGTGADAWQDVEVVLMMLYEVGEAGLDDMTKPDCGALAPLVTALAHSCGAAGQQLAAGQGGEAAGAAGDAGGGPGPRVSESSAQALGIRALPAAHHPLVSLVVLELFVRYSRVLQQAPALLPGVILTFLDSRGMDHPLEDVSTRACYLFCRLCKSLRSQLRAYLPSILPSLTPILAWVLTTPVVDSPASQGRDIAAKAMAPTNAVIDDRLYVFEAVGLLLGQDEVDPEQQAAALASLLQPLTAQIQANLRSAPGGAVSGAAAPSMIIQAMEATVRLSKGFRTDLVTRQRPQLGRMFVGMFEVALAVPREYPEHPMLRARFISCVHRLVEGLQGLLVPLLPSALEPLVGLGPQGSPEALTDVLVLANQLACRFKEGLAPLMDALLPVVITRLHALLGSDWDWSGRSAAASTASIAAMLAAQAAEATAAGPGGQQTANGRTISNASNGGVAGISMRGMSVAMSGTSSVTLEDAREKGELQRAYYGLLHSISHQGLSGALLTHDPAVVLEPVMTSLTRGATAHVDSAVRRTCVQIYCRLITEWTSSGSAEAIPGFKRYAMEHLGGEACILSVVQSQPPLEPREGGTLALLQELAGALKLVYERCGEDFSAHLLSVVGPAAGLPPAFTEQLVTAIRVSEVKELRDCLRHLLVQSQQAAQQGPATPTK